MLNVSKIRRNKFTYSDLVLALKKCGIKNDLFSVFIIRNIDDLCLPLMVMYGTKSYIVKKMELHNKNKDFISIFCKLEGG